MSKEKIKRVFNISNTIVLFIVLIIFLFCLYWVFIKTPKTQKWCHNWASTYFQEISDEKILFRYNGCMQANNTFQGIWSIKKEDIRYKLCQTFIKRYIYCPSYYYPTVKSQYKTEILGPSPSTPSNNLSVDLRLDTNNKPLLADVSEDEFIKIEEKINMFEEYKYAKDFTSAINMFTKPETIQEQSWLDYLLGNDLASLNNGIPAPRFLNNANYHILVGYDIKKVNRKDNAYYVNVNELRLINISEGSEPTYKADLQNLTFEFINTDGNYQISRYYHTKATSVANSKYEGFVAY